MEGLIRNDNPRHAQCSKTQDSECWVGDGLTIQGILREEVIPQWELRSRTSRSLGGELIAMVVSCTGVACLICLAVLVETDEIAPR